MPDKFEKQLRALSDSLQAPLRPTDIENVLPLIVPRSYFQRGNWPGPYVLLRHPRLGLTWVILEENETMLYVNHERAEEFVAKMHRGATTPMLHELLAQEHLEVQGAA